MKNADVSSPPLFAACASGQHYGGAVVNLLKATGTSGMQQIFWTYTFTDVMVESIQWSGSSGGSDVPTESVSFAFGKVQIDYFTQDTATGSMTNAGTASWNLTTTSSHVIRGLATSLAESTSPRGFACRPNRIESNRRRLQALPLTASLTMTTPDLRDGERPL